MTSVTKVALMNCKGVTDAGLMHLQGLTKVKTLYLPYTSVGDAGLEHAFGSGVDGPGGSPFDFGTAGFTCEGGTTSTLLVSA